MAVEGGEEGPGGEAAVTVAVTVAVMAVVAVVADMVAAVVVAPSVIIVGELVTWREIVISDRVVTPATGDAAVAVAVVEGVLTVVRKGILRGNVPTLKNER